MPDKRREQKTYSTLGLVGLVSVQTYTAPALRNDITAIAAARGTRLVDYIAQLIEENVEKHSALIPTGRERLSRLGRYKSQLMALDTSDQPWSADERKL